jgi:hypothetical protein
LAAAYVSNEGSNGDDDDGRQQAEVVVSGQGALAAPPASRNGLAWPRPSVPPRCSARATQRVRRLVVPPSARTERLKARRIPPWLA